MRKAKKPPVTQPAIFVGGVKDPRSAQFVYGQTGTAIYVPWQTKYVIFEPHGAPEESANVLPEALKLCSQT